MTPLTVSADTTVESAETVTVALGSDPAYALGAASATLTILGRHVLSVVASDPTASEGSTDTAGVAIKDSAPG